MAFMTESLNLAQKIIDDRVKGYNYLDIANKHGVEPIEALAIVREALESTSMRDPIEMRGILMLRLEALIQNMWDQIEKGSFKHVEAAVKAMDRLSELLDLNQQTIKHEISVMSDEETVQMIAVLKSNNTRLYERLSALELGDGARLELESSWAQWTADTAMEAVEEIILVEDLEDGVYK